MTRRKTPASCYARQVLASSFAEFRAHATAAGEDEDVDGVHDMRVATRRLRSDVSTFRDVLPSVFEHLRSELKWVGATLGAVRDLDVEIATLREARDGMTGERRKGIEALIEQLQAGRNAAQAELKAALASQRYEDVLDGFIDALDDKASIAGEPVVAEVAESVVGRRWRQLSKAAAVLRANSPPELFHATRVRAKQLRYTVEAFLSLYGERAQHLAAEATQIQDVLGRHQDLIVLNRRLESLIREDTLLPPWALVVLGELIERNRQDAQAIRHEWSGLNEARKRWRDLKDVI